MVALLTGLVAGLAHVLSGPDHWVAVAPLSVAKPTHAFKYGLRWGAGHGAGVVAMGAGGLFLKDVFTLDAVSAMAEVLVGVVLVVTGVWAFRRAKLVVIHTHDHDHGADSHDHVHVHLAYDADRHATDHGNHGHAATSIGLLHGVAGSGHVWGLLPALALPPQHTVLYLGAFVVSSTVAMIAVSLGIGRLLRARTDVFMRSALRWSGGLSCAVGGVWFVYSIT
ncbi:MAG: hydantoin utilization protein A [Bradymonadia bacterium]